MRTSKPVTKPLYTIVKRMALKGGTFVCDLAQASTKCVEKPAPPRRRAFVGAQKWGWLRGRKAGIVLLTGTLLFGSYGTAHSENSPPPATIIPFTNAFGVVVLRVRINGRGPFNFMLDTGSRTTIIAPNLAKALGLPALRPVSQSGAGAHEISSIETRLASISLSGLTRRNVEATEMPLPEGLEHRLPQALIQGYVGWEFFKDFALTIDYGAARLLVSKYYVPAVDAMTEPMRLAFGGTVPAVDARFDDAAGTFLLDSGNSGWPTLNHAFAERAKIGARYPTGARTSSEAAGNQSSPQIELCLDRFALGSKFHMAHVPAYVDVADVGVSAWPDQDGTIGYEMMRRVRTTLDFGKHLVYFERTKSVAAADYATTTDCTPNYGFGLAGG
jgi:hypothetical protein